MRSYVLTPSSPKTGGRMFVNHAVSGRSGHLGHALVQCADGSILAFYTDCDGKINNGHNGVGWIAYKRSADGGRTWSVPSVLDCSMKAYRDTETGVTYSCEKAVCAADGTLVAALLQNRCQPAWEPFERPLFITSRDNGKTWSEPAVLSEEKGRPYDMRADGDTIYVLHFANDATTFFCGNRPEHRYLLLVSTDCGKTFTQRSVVPLPAMGRGYGEIQPTPDGRLIAYAYNSKDEYHMDAVISEDGGLTWGEPTVCEMKKRIRNPQIGLLNGLYFLHGRSGCMTHELPMNMVLYTSEDGLHWDDGKYIRVNGDPEAWGGCAYYSNNIAFTDPVTGKKRLLIQSSDAYEKGRTNIVQWFADTEEKPE